MKQTYEKGSLQEQMRKDIIKSKEHLKKMNKMRDKLNYIKLPKDMNQRITDLENELYNFNSQVVSLLWIGVKHKPEEEQIVYLNSLLGRTIKLLRELKDEE